MDKSIGALVNEWEFIRSCSKAFIRELSDEQLDSKLPRKGLDTFRKHFQEMIEVQRDYTAALTSGVMAFNGIPDAEIDGRGSKEELLEAMAALDEEMIELLRAAVPDQEIRWFGQSQLLPFHLSALICHEAQHIGQIIAFSYCQDFAIPEFVKNNWALSGK